MSQRSKRSQVVHLALKRVTPREIAHQLGMNKSSVYAHIAAARKDGVEIPYFTRPSNSVPFDAQTNIDNDPQTEARVDAISVPLRLRALLEREAERRNMAPQDLARQLLEQKLLEGAVRHG